jgi:hypothetical protein
MKFLTRNGRPVNLPNSDLISVLQDANLITAFVEPPRTIVPQTVWNVDEGTGETVDCRITARCLTVGCSLNEARYNQPETFRVWHCGIKGGELAPKAIVAKFNDLKKQQAQS